MHGSGQQADSLLGRLSIELRLRIYDNVLGHRKVHLAFEFGPREYRKNKYREHVEWRWWHCICTWDQIDEIYWDRPDHCRSGRVGGTQGPPNGMMGKLKLDFAILLTCRQV